MGLEDSNEPEEERERERIDFSSELILVSETVAELTLVVLKD